MKPYHYSARFAEVKKIFEVPTRKEGNSVRISELNFDDKSYNPVFDIRIYHENFATNIGVITNEYVIRRISEFLFSYFEEKDNEFINEQLGDIPCEESKRE